MILLKPGKHHERLDGRGYPSGHRSKEIPIAGRIVAVADALTHERPYKHAWPHSPAQLSSHA